MTPTSITYMRGLLSDRIKFLANETIMALTSDNFEAMANIATEAAQAACALADLTREPAPITEPVISAGEIRVMKEVFDSVARNVRDMRELREATDAAIGDESAKAHRVLTDLLRTFNPERVKQDDLRKEREAGRSARKAPMDSAGKGVHPRVAEDERHDREMTLGKAAVRAEDTHQAAVELAKSLATPPAIAH